MISDKVQGKCFLCDGIAKEFGVVFGMDWVFFPQRLYVIEVKQIGV